MELQTAINWRYATKRMTGEKVAEKDLSQILEAVRLAPSSIGLQPFKVLVVGNHELKREIEPIADGQPQVVECSHLLIFAAETGATKDGLEQHIQRLARERSLPIEKLDGLKKVLMRDQLNMDAEEYYHWSSKQAYIAMSYGQLMAATLGIDAAAMEGFDCGRLDELLALSGRGLRSCVLMAIGYRDEVNDYMLRLKKVRKSESELFIKLNREQ